MAGLHNGLARISILSFDISGQAVSNSFYVVDPGAGSPPNDGELAGLLTDLSAWFDTTYLALLWTGSTLDSWSAKQVVAPGGSDVPIEHVLSINAAGTAGSAGSTLLPEPICPVVSLKTGFASRRARGHMFLPPALKSGSTDRQTFQTGTWWTAVQAYTAKLAAGCGSSPSWTGTHLSNYNLCVYSKTADAAAETAIFACTTAVTGTKVHYLRSRAKGAT